MNAEPSMVEEVVSASEKKQMFPMAAKLRSNISLAVNYLSGMDRIVLAGLMLSISVMYHSVWVPDDLTKFIAVAGLIFHPLLKQWWYWLALGGLRVAYQIPNHWATIDNHQYLLTYAVLAFGLTLLASEREAAFRLMSRLLIGLCFMFATIWKIISPDFLPGSFMHWTMLKDTRFEQFAVSFLGLPAGAMAENRTAIGKLLEIGDTATLTSGSLVPLAGVLLAWWTVIIEGSIAAAFLLPKENRFTRMRSALLFIFIITTYLIAPVVGFAWLLLSLNILARFDSQKWTPFISVVLFSLLVLFSRFDDLLLAFF